MTDFEEAAYTALEADFPATGLQAMSHRRPPGTNPTTIGDELLHVVAIIDSHSLTRESIAKSILHISSNLKIIPFSSVADCNDRKADEFGLVILYLHESEHEPLELIRNVRSATSEAVLFLISDHDYRGDPEFVRVAWRLGARGFVSTETTSLTLALSAIRFVQAGGFFAPFDALLSRAPPPPKPPPARVASAKLTARETVVLGLLKEGKTNKVIARELRLSNNTVKVHVQNILRKMKVSTRTEAALSGPPAVAAGDRAVRMN